MNLERPIRSYLHEIERLLETLFEENVPGAADEITQFLEALRDKTERFVLKLERAQKACE